MYTPTLFNIYVCVCVCVPDWERVMDTSIGVGFYVIKSMGKDGVV